MLGVVQFAAQWTKELKTGQVLVRFDLRFLTRQIAKNRTVRSKTGHLATLRSSAAFISVSWSVAGCALYRPRAYRVLWTVDHIPLS